MKIMFKPCFIALLAVIADGATAPVRALDVAIDFAPESIWVSGGGPNTYGWEFSTHADIELLALGLWDGSTVVGGQGGGLGDGLYEPHPMAIWDLADPASPVLSATIPMGKQTFLIRGFRYIAITPLVLPAGHRYAIAAKYSELSVDNLTGEINNPLFELTLGPALGFAGYRWGGGSSELVFPDHYVGDVGAFGPNFMYRLLEPYPAVPDGGPTLVLMALCVGLIAAARRIPVHWPH